MSYNKITNNYLDKIVLIKMIKNNIIKLFNNNRNRMNK
jgi:hypothetical protein